MFANCLKLGWRNLSRNGTYSVIIISGLVLAHSACLAIFLFVKSETSYDRQSPDADRIYRVVHTAVDDEGTRIADPTTPSTMGPLLMKDISQLASVVRIMPTSVSQVTWLVSSGFLKMVIVANLLAWPATYTFMNDWLNGFAYHIDINWIIFGGSGVVALLIAMMTIAGQSIKAAQANPVQSLRNE